MPPPRLPAIAYLWPGLPHVWMRGSWAGLALAVGFTALLNTLLATSLVWREWLPLRVRWAGLATLVVIWALSWLEARADWRRWLAERSAEGEPEDPDQRRLRMFREAQQCYLAGDWVVAEQVWLRLLKQDARDAEARLALATLWRHQRRFQDAVESLSELERLEPAAPWHEEIRREWELLEQSQTEETTDHGATVEETLNEATLNEETQREKHDDAREEREPTYPETFAGRRAA